MKGSPLYVQRRAELPAMLGALEAKISRLEELRARLGELPNGDCRELLRLVSGAALDDVLAIAAAAIPWPSREDWTYEFYLLRYDGPLAKWEGVANELEALVRERRPDKYTSVTVSDEKALEIATHGVELMRQFAAAIREYWGRATDP